MSVSTLRPTGTTSNTGTLTGGATAHAVLSDDSDASYISFDENERCEVTLGDFTLPADAVLKSVGWRLRCAKAGGVNKHILTNLGSTAGGIFGSVQVSWQTATTVTAASGQTEYIGLGGVEITDALLDATSLECTNDSAGTLLVYEAYVDVSYVDQPVVGIGQPSGTVSDDTSPTVTWLQSIDSAGGNVTAFEVKVYTAAQYGAGGFDPDESEATIDSGTVADNTANGANLWALPEHLDDGTYRVYVRVRQTVNGEELWSDWDFEGFVIDAVRPDAPTLTLTADDSSARVLIEVEQGEQERTNLITNPKAGTNTTDWTPTSMVTFERVTSLPTSSGLPSGITTGFHGVGNANSDRATFTFTPVTGQTYTASVYVRLVSLSATSLRLGITQGFNPGSETLDVTAVGGSFVRRDVTMAAFDGTAMSVALTQIGAGAVEWHATAVLLEEAAAVDTYFDGDSDNSAWTGTDENSTSTQGADTNLFYIERSDDGGGSWIDVRTGHSSGAAFLVPSAGAASVYDYEGPNGTSVQYRVSAIAVTDFAPLTLIGSAYDTDSAMWEDGAIWLKDPANPELNVRIP